jgi:hypothetical protein
LKDPERTLKDDAQVLRAELLQVPNGRSDLLLRVVLIFAHSAEFARRGEQRRRVGEEMRDNPLSKKLDGLLVHVLAVVQVEQLAILLLQPKPKPIREAPAPHLSSRARKKRERTFAANNNSSTSSTSHQFSILHNGPTITGFVAK